MLVLDDVSTMSRIIKNTVQMLGHQESLEAEHVLEAWNILTHNDGIEVLITYLNMPEMNSLDLMK